MAADPTTREERLLNAWCLIVLLIAVACTALLLTLQSSDLPILEILLLALLCAFAEGIAVRLPNGSSASASVMVSLAAVVVCRSAAPLIGPLLVGMAGGVYLPHLRQRDWKRLSFNVGTFGLSTLAAAVAFSAISGPAAPISTVLVGAIAAAAAYWVMDLSLLGVVLCLSTDTSLRTYLGELLSPTELQIVLFAVIGAFIGELYDALGALVLVLSVTPILIARHAFASYTTGLATHQEILLVLVRALEAKDPYTAGHVQRVALFASYIGKEFAFLPTRMRRLRDAALLHDIGKLVVPNHLLNKPGRLTPSEFDRVRQHEGVSAELIGRIDEVAACTPALTDVSLDAPLESRIIMVADAFDAMTSTRSYRRAMSQDDAVAELRANVGQQFDGPCVEALVAALSRRGKRYGAGEEAESARSHFAEPPPVVGAGSAGLGDLEPESATASKT